MAEKPEGVITPGNRAPSLAQGDTPDDVRRRYLTEGHGLALAYYTDLTAKQPAFSDAGRRLETERSNPAVIRDMLAIAQHRGWTKVQVRGSEEFRREAWLQAQAQGLDVGGYRPTGRDRQELERRTAPMEREDPAPTKSGPDQGRGVTGELVDMGRAPYKNRAGADESAFVKLKLESGRHQTVWGVGLPAAMEQSGAKIGDTVTVQRVGVETVSKLVQEKDKETGEVRRERKEVDRNKWEIVAARFREATPEQAARDPELRGAQSRLNTVEAVVRARVVDRPAQDRILSAARERLARWLEQGVRVQPVSVGRSQVDHEPSRGRERQRSR